MASDDSTAWLELADCLSAMKQRQGEAHNAYVEALRLQTDQLAVNPQDGPGWMLLSLFHAKTGSQSALSLLKKADENYSGDLDSQLCRIRVLEVLGHREDALQTAAGILRRGAPPSQIEQVADLQNLILDRKFRRLIST